MARGGRRVTLKWKAQPLRLPGEDDSEGRLESSAPPAEPGTDPGRDGWEREHPHLTPPPPPATDGDRDGDGDGDALTLVDRRSRPSSPTIDISGEMHDRFALGDFTASLRLAELVLGRAPLDSEAVEIARACREKLVALHTSRLGNLSRCPMPAVEGAEMRWLGLDHRAGFVLSQIDGKHTAEELVDLCGMSRLELLKTLVELLDMDAIRFP